MSDERKCTLCGGTIGPDITDRPMCYQCGPVDMVPRERPEYSARHQAGVADGSGLASGVGMAEPRS